MRIRSKQKLLLLNVSVFLLLNCSCSIKGITKGKEISESSVEQIHNQYNAGRLDEVYAQADEEFRKSTSEKDFLTLFEAVHRKLGAVKQSEQSGWNVNATTSGVIVTLAYDVDFDEGKGTEQFVFRVNNGKAMLLNYNVNSPLLIIK
jgi:uncharacterized protein DUF3887